MNRIAPQLIALALAGCGETPTKTETSNEGPKYKIGQVWNYTTRKGEEGSRIFIVRADPNEKLGTTYHIYIDGLKIKNPKTDTGIQDIHPYAPVSKKTLDESVTSIVTESAPELPDISIGYESWKKYYNGATFTIPAREIIQELEDRINGNLKDG